jgi:hypothetical protein
MAQDDPNIAQEGPKLAQDGPDMTSRYPQHRPKITEVDPNNARYRQHVKVSVEWRKPLEYMNIDMHIYT